MSRPTRFVLSAEDSAVVRGMLDLAQPDRQLLKQRRSHAAGLKLLIVIVLACIAALLYELLRSALGGS
jgi:hypothetical protein